MTGTLVDLPPAPLGRFGWPWTDPQQANASGKLRVTVVTPNFNQTGYLEATIRAALQSFPGLEYFVIDGNSADASRDIIARFAPYVNCWVTEPDRGQAQRSKKGFERATGDVMAWLNPDDYYTPGAVARVLSEFESD